MNQQPFTDPGMAELAASWVAGRRDPADALRAAREGLKHFGLLGGFHIALSRFEAAVRADARAMALAEAATAQAQIAAVLALPAIGHEALELMDPEQYHQAIGYNDGLAASTHAITDTAVVSAPTT